MMRTALVLDCIVVFIQLSGLLLLAAFNILSAQTVFFCIGGGGIIAIVGWLYWQRHTYFFIVNNTTKDFKKNFSFGKWILASGYL